jgi:hypothetical protein
MRSSHFNPSASSGGRFGYKPPKYLEVLSGPAPEYKTKGSGLPAVDSGYNKDTGPPQLFPIHDVDF